MTMILKLENLGKKHCLWHNNSGVGAGGAVAPPIISWGSTAPRLNLG